MVVGPAVIPASKRSAVAALLLAYGRRAMHTAIHHDVEVAVLVARHDGGLRADWNGFEIARRRHLALVADEHPVALEDAFHLELEDFLAQGRSCDERGCPAPTLQASTVTT